MSRAAPLLDELQRALGWEHDCGLQGLPHPHASGAPGAPAAASARLLPAHGAPHAAPGGLDSLYGPWRDCQRCALARQRRSLVFGEGPVPARLAFIGEGPGEAEDRSGRPFVGAAGEQLERMIRAMGLAREQVFISNIVKCRPPDNRDPQPEEVSACAPLLRAQLALVAPEVIVALGRVAAHALLDSHTPLSTLRGQWGRYETVAVMPTYHPAYLLRNPRDKGPVWEDLKAVLRRLELPIPEPVRRGPQR